MAAPTFVGAGNGVAVTGTGATGFGKDSGINGGGDTTPGNFLVIHVIQDGTGADGTLASSAAASLTHVEDLAGTDEAITMLTGSPFAVGSPTAAKHFVGLARVLNAASTVTFQTAGDDWFGRVYEFSGVSTGTTLATVIENGSAGAAVNGVGSTAAISDTGVTTLGADRLAINLVAVNDDNLLDAFTGETGGDWTEPVAEFASSGGTDAALGIQIATIASAGTINGGTDTMAAADGWGVVGFALLPAAAAAPASLIYQPGIQAAIPRSLYAR